MSGLDVFCAATFWLSLLALAYVYRGYLLLLEVLVRLRRLAAGPVPPPKAEMPETGWPSLTVLLTVHDEEAAIAARLDDILAQDYPADRLEILVASDGSTDGTECIVEDYAAAPGCGGAVRLFRSPDQLGKSGTQNAAMAEAGGEIVVLTDAGTRFAPGFLKEIATPFADPAVGCVSGGLTHLERPGAIAEGQARYWRYETRLRARESELGILAVASGQAMAFRRRLFRPLPLHVGDDCMIPLDVALAGYRVVHCASALADDALAYEAQAELRARMRMTLRNWTGTWLRPALLDPLRHPGYALALWSHKLLRWLSPVFLLLLSLSALWLARLPFYRPFAVAILALYGLALVGLRNSRHGRRWAPAAAAYGFMIGNLGFLGGLWKAMVGRRIIAYRSGPPKS